MRKIVLVTMLLLGPLFVNATQVRWNEVNVNTDYIEGGQGFCIFSWLDDRGPYFTYEVFCDFVSGPWGQNWRLSPTATSSKGGIVMYKAEADSVVNHDAAQQSTYFVNAHGGVVNDFEAEVPWTPLSDSDPGLTDEDVYLAIILTDYDGNEIYGWMELQVLGRDGNGYLLGWHSALDLDGGPMVVGGGAWDGSTPEPASGLLLLVGCALLALKRRRNLV